MATHTEIPVSQLVVDHTANNLAWPSLVTASSSNCSRVILIFSHRSKKDHTLKFTGMCAGTVPNDAYKDKTHTLVPFLLTMCHTDVGSLHPSLSNWKVIRVTNSALGSHTDPAETVYVRMFFCV